jgi:hypothetical protein
MTRRIVCTLGVALMISGESLAQSGDDWHRNNITVGIGPAS